MTSRRKIAMGAAAAVVWAAGCQSQSSKHQQPSQESNSPLALQSPAQPSADAKAQGNAVGGADSSQGRSDSVDALTRKAEAISRELSPLMNARAAAQMPGRPSAVEWMDPSQFRLGVGGGISRQSYGDDARGAAPDQATVKPVMDSSLAMAPAGVAAQPDALVQPGASPKLRTGGDANSAIALADPSPHLTQVRLASPPVSADALAEKLSRRVKEYPRDVCAQLEYQLLQFLLDEPTPQLAALSALPSEDREVVTAVLDGLTNFRNALRADNNMLLSKKIKPILDMSERLRTQADLTIPTISLCKRVNGFGSYDPIDPARFDAGVDHPVIVYCEVGNFTSNLNDKQMWETRLAWDMTLYTESGMSVWSDKSESISDSSRNRRHDFFVRKMITLPKSLTIGRYLLKVTIVDSQSNRVSEATTPIVIAAQ